MCNLQWSLNSPNIVGAKVGFPGNRQPFLMLQ